MKAIDPAFAESIGTLARSLGRSDFAELLLGLLGSLVASDMTTMTRYSRFSKPDYLVHSESYDEAMAERYLAHYYRFDPFYRYWRSTERPGVVWLGDLATEGLRRGRYVREFLAQSGVSDEVGVFLPPLGRASVALFLERGKGRFTKQERALLESLYPIMAGLYQAHVSMLFGSAPETGGGLALPVLRPLLVTDATGQHVFANAAWQAQEAERSGELAKAQKQLAQAGHDQTSLPNGHVLHREALDGSFRLAPGGQLWMVEPAATAPEETRADAVPALFADQFTPREQEIVALILEGHPTIAIAERLGLSRGTVKNHRRRIYHKLDITSERELFLLHIERLSVLAETGQVRVGTP
ncbi:MAG: LuxR C-terminal-related transcriptional regulator [Rhodospirillales bacterium]|nr:LuxR C-terminal-related transcriptional regulator [Rhodospirillales bacterium]